MKAVIGAAALSLVLALAGAADATQITGGDSSTGSYDFHNAGTAKIDIASPGLTGVAFFPGQPAGSYNLGAFAPVVAGPLVGGNFATNGHQSVSVAIGPYSLAGDFNFTLVKDHSDHPDLIGTIAIASSSFPGFNAGETGDMDVTLTYLASMGGVEFLDDLALNGGVGSWDTISSFEIDSRTPSIPEPDSLLLIGLALVAVGVFRRAHIRPGAKSADEQLAATAI